MTYKRIETWKQNDEEDEVYTYLVNINPADAIDYATEAGHLITHFEPVKFEDIHSEQLVDMIEDELEDQNRHSATGLANRIRFQAEELFGYVGAKQLLWNMISMHGASLGL